MKGAFSMLWHSFPISLAILAAYFSTVSAKCTSYTAKPNRYSSDGSPYTSIGATHRVSEAVNCTGSRLGSGAPQGEQISGTSKCDDDQCWVATPANYFIQSGSTLNISTTTDVYNSIMKLLETSIHYTMEVDWNGTVAYSINSNPQAQCIPEGQSGYIGFTPYTLCTEGILSGCTGDGPSDNTAIMACGSILLNAKMFLGEFHTVNTGADFNASTAAVPPNATIPDNSANVPGNGVSSLHTLSTSTYAMACLAATIALFLLL